MKFNKKLFPMKAHYFLLCAGSAPIFPFMPVILKDLGFSSISVGWIFTAYPLFALFCKPMLGTIADRYRCHRFLNLVLLFFHLIIMFGIQWAPGLPTYSKSDLICDEDLKLRICSEKLNDSNYEFKLLKSLNDTVSCKVPTENWDKIIKRRSTQNDSNHISGDVKEVSIKIGPNISRKENCWNIQVSNILETSEEEGKECRNSKLVSSNIYCKDTTIMEVITKPLIKTEEEMGTHQFWIVFAIIISIRVAGSVIQSFSDAFCLEYLGDKPENYGKQRLWGAVGWGLLSLVNGLVVDRISRGHARKNFLPSYYMLLVILLLDIIVVLNIKVNFIKKSKNITSDVTKLFKDIRICIFLLWCFICGVYCAIVWNFLFWFIEDLASHNPQFDAAWIKTLEGLVLTVQCYFGEIPFFFFSGRFLRKVGHPKAMMIVLLFYGLRFLLYYSLTNPWWILPIEVFNGITFGLFYATMVTYANSIAPPGTEATMQNVVSSVFEGAGTAIGSLLGGYLFKKVGSSFTIFILGVSAVVFSFIYFCLQGKLVTEKEKLGIREGKDVKESENFEELKTLNTPY